MSRIEEHPKNSCCSSESSDITSTPMLEPDTNASCCGTTEKDSPNTSTIEKDSACCGTSEKKKSISGTIEEENACCSTSDGDRLSSSISEKESTCCSTSEKNNSGCCSSEQGAEEKSKQNISPSLALRTYKVEGMDCPSCAATIEKSLGKNESIQSAEVNYGTGKLKVEASSVAVLDEVPKLVGKIGFDIAAPVVNYQAETYVIEGMDCGSCAQTIEKHLSQHPDVKEARVNFSTGKLHIQHTASPDVIMKEVEKSGFKASVDSKGKREETVKSKPKDLRTTISGSFLGLGFISSFTALPEMLSVMFYAVSILVGGYKPAKSAFYSIKSGSLDMNVLMASAALGAALIGEWFEGAMVVWLFALGNMLQNRSIERTRDSIRSLIDLTPSEATVKSGSEWIKKSVEEITIGEVLLIKPGEKVPLDGEIISGASSLNQAPITGESLPVDKKQGDEVFAGTINEHGSIQVKVTKLVEDTTIANIIHLVEEAQAKKAPTQAFVDRFASVYTPIVFILALLIMVFPPLLGFGTWGDWIYKGLALLVVACPCALVISTPVAIVSAIGNAAKNGVLIKGGTFLEKAGAITAMAFDKTGTLTEGKPRVTQLIDLNNNRDDLLAIARTIEEHSTHPIASAITSYAEERHISAQNGTDYEAIAGKGAKAVIDGVEYFAGNPKLFKEMNIALDKVNGEIHSIQNDGGSIVLVGTRKKVLGIIGVSDTIREITVQSIQHLKQAGLNELVMLTGDNDGTAKKIASSAGVDRYFSELLPEDKVKAIKELQAEGKRVAMVGDGINDAPALATADLGIAMGGAGTDTAMETADIVLMADNLEKLPHTVRLSRRTLAIIKQNVWFSLITKFAALLLIFPGLLTLWMAVLADTGAALVVIINSMRLLRQK
ncbi:heavy metal translocating P-type ATPase [Halobacillus mangrovi]|uniref:Cd(2+)-exporting ATPase n=2 Tax=Halobacillus mangrovi TaxID=402384 RepID=A0A1W5ZWY7_9BACI|nr:heavy metal translocating P-type ATPase [Halobacillus mangrovi]ARI77761.1 heavy metal translocating P-type ATPase [Halobacillus mangrovi]